MTKHLTVVADLATTSPKTETVAVRVRRLQQEARQLARDHIKTLCQALVEVETLSAEIAAGGEAYPPGIRDLARRLIEDCEARAQTLEAIVARA
ncbi:MAG TPA: hypothetical protein VJP88_08615 [Caulobacteraceae bacterium]|nr:hypothetical protein [Caulobacteraceae bacterium]